jgi:hypothetical protein
MPHRTPRTLRALALPAAVAAACAVAVPTQAALAGGVADTLRTPQATKAAPAGGGFYGVWILKSWDINGRVLPCPVTLSLPPGAPPISCVEGEFLKLFRSGRYETNLPAFAREDAHRGVFVAIAFGGKAGNAIVFEDDAVQDEPRVYRMSLGRSGAKAPKTMVISTNMGIPGGGRSAIAMNFTRYTR